MRLIRLPWPAPHLDLITGNDSGIGTQAVSAQNR